MSRNETARDIPATEAYIVRSATCASQCLPEQDLEWHANRFFLALLSHLASIVTTVALPLRCRCRRCAAVQMCSRPPPLQSSHAFPLTPASSPLETDPAVKRMSTASALIVCACNACLLTVGTEIIPVSTLFRNLINTVFELSRDWQFSNSQARRALKIATLRVQQKRAW